MLEAGHRQAQVVIDGAHPVGVALGQVVVHRHQVGALALQGVEIQGEGGHQRLALAGLHLGDLALMKNDAAQELDIEVALAQTPLGHLPHHGEGIRQDVVQVSPSARRWRNWSVLARSSASLRGATSSSRALISSTSG